MRLLLPVLLALAVAICVPCPPARADYDVFTADNYVLHSETANAVVRLAYPQTNIPAINEQVLTLLRGRRAAFLDEVGTTRPQPGGRHDLFGTFHSSRFDARIHSLVFEFSIYTGGAHPRHEVVTRTFDASSGRTLAIGDLFAKPWTQQVAELVRDELVNRQGFDKEVVAAGAGPKPENFQRFALREDTLRLYFEPYAVGPYFLGVVTVDIPLPALREVLRPELSAGSDKSVSRLPAEGCRFEYFASSRLGVGLAQEICPSGRPWRLAEAGNALVVVEQVPQAPQPGMAGPQPGVQSGPEARKIIEVFGRKQGETPDMAIRRVAAERLPKEARCRVEPFTRLSAPEGVSRFALVPEKPSGNLPAQSCGDLDGAQETMQYFEFQDQAPGRFVFVRLGLPAEGLPFYDALGLRLEPNGSR